MSALLSRVHSWVAEAPWLALVMLVGVAAIFWWVLRSQGVPEWSARKAPWLRVVALALALPTLFFILLWGCEANLASVESIWGRPHVQRDLTVYHTYLVPVTEEVRDQFGRIVTRTRMETREAPQNSITRTRGDVTLTRSERQKGTARYPGFTLDVAFDYTVKNFADRRTDAHFTFPLSPGQTMFDGFTVRVNGEDMSSRLLFDPYAVTWTLPMNPGQVENVSVTYRSRGLRRFYYQVSDVRELRDFLLVLRLPDIPLRDVNYPEGCITPTTRKAEGTGSVLEWQLDRALTTRGMGIALPQPAQPGAQVARVLGTAWRGGMLLLVTVALTAIVLGTGFHPLRLLLLGAVFVGEFMLMAAVSDYVPSFWLAWALAALPAIGAAYLILGGRRAPLPLLALPVVFMAVYPLLVLPREIAPSLLLGMDVLTVLYLAVLGILALRRAPEAPPLPPAAAEDSP
ncbi:MAG: hypothetical protein BWY76_00081 [bacterium ADurb.Bin429]|nr:MAG: hypothetical protein BWY76_00081 [bacterium ADurb.Bin429]